MFVLDIWMVRGYQLHISMLGFEWLIGFEVALPKGAVRPHCLCIMWEVLFGCTFHCILHNILRALGLRIHGSALCPDNRRMSASSFIWSVKATQGSDRKGSLQIIAASRCRDNWPQTCKTPPNPVVLICKGTFVQSSVASLSASHRAFVHHTGTAADVPRHPLFATCGR